MRGRALWAAVCSLVLAACGSGGGGGGEDPDGGETADASPVAPDGAPVGPVRLTDSKIFPQRNSSTAITFGIDTEGPGTCLSEVVAGCEVQDCEDATGAVHVSAGTVTLTTPLGEAVHTPDVDNAYPVTPAIDWEPGDTITLTVAGAGDIPAFEASVPGPGAITSMSAPSADEPTVVTRGEPLAFAWEGADAAVTAVVSCNVAAGGIQQVRCRFPGGVQASQMPAEALERLPACDTANVYLLTEERVITGPPGLAVRFGPRGPIFGNPATVE